MGDFPDIATPNFQVVKARSKPGRNLTQKPAREYARRAGNGNMNKHLGW